MMRELCRWYGSRYKYLQWAKENATAVNKQGGVITVYNAGIGMAAYGASNTVINEGIINLEKMLTTIVVWEQIL